MITNLSLSNEMYGRPSFVYTIGDLQVVFLLLKLECCYDIIVGPVVEGV